MSLQRAILAGLHNARNRLERGVRRTLHADVPSWRRQPNSLPWFDRPDALDVLARSVEGGDTDTRDARLLEKWIRDGYVVVEGCVDASSLDAVNKSVDGLWDSESPIPGLTLLDLRESPDSPPRNLSHAELLRLDRDIRHRMREVSDWRIHEFHAVDRGARRIYGNRRLRELASRIFRKPARPIALINFMYGSRQPLHQDMAVFHIHPHNYLIGAWIACEDVDGDQGPLLFYPRSHRTPLFPGFTDYPQTNLRTVGDRDAQAYQEYVDALAGEFECRRFIARKGDILLWHGSLIHGGAPIERPGSTRRSMVIHYSVRGADKGREVVGPFRW